MKILTLVLSITDDDFIDDVIGDVIDDVVWSSNVIQEPSLYTTDHVVTYVFHDHSEDGDRQPSIVQTSSSNP